MSISKLYKVIKPSIVAFVAKYSADGSERKATDFPRIIGTGFVIDSFGIILTNNQVIEHFNKLPKPEGVSPLASVNVMLFVPDEGGIRLIGLDVWASATIKTYNPYDSYFELYAPDLGLVFVNLDGLPAYPVRQRQGGIIEGMEIGTAGFPMGTGSMQYQGKDSIRQVSPFLQNGVISAIQPYPVPNPYCFTINVMLQNGASGSPVFSIDSGEVIGIAFERMYEPAKSTFFSSSGKGIKTEDKEDAYAITMLPTNFSYVVPTYYITKSDLSRVKANFKQSLTFKRSTLKEYLRVKTPIDFKSGKVMDSINYNDRGQIVLEEDQ